MPDHPATRTRGDLWIRGYRPECLLLPGLLLACGCLYGGKEATDDTVRSMVSRPYDQLPEQLREKTITPGKDQPPAGKDQPPASKGQADRKPETTPIQTDIQTAAYMQGAPPGKAFELRVPEAIPGSEVAPLSLPAEPAARAAALNKLYPPLPPLEAEVKPLPGPNGQPYTLSDFQRIAAENSPTLRQAASDLQAAKGNIIQTSAYANPNVSLQEQPSNNSSTSAAFGFAFDQVVNTGGKQQLQVAQAKKQYDNAVLALKRARSDLATQVRTAYYALLVAKETMRVNRALSVLTDEVYRVQLAFTLNAGQSAAYEPAALRAQAWSARVAYQSGIAAYVYAWKTMVATIGERQLPLTEVAGRIDAFVPYYEYDKVLGHVLQHHTDALTALNGIDIQKWNLKYNQVLPYYPNLDFNIGLFKDQALFPYGTYATFTVTAPLPVWNQNRGNILQAESALTRALEEPHRVELALTNLLANNYANYKTNLVAVESFRRYVLPDQIRAYRGTLLRRQVDVNAQFGDLVAAQQALASSVTTYLNLLGSLWTSVVSVADMLQTDDLFQNAEARGLPALPIEDLENRPPLPCCHPFGHSGGAPAGAAPGCPTPTPLLAPTPLPPLPPPSATPPGTSPQPPTPMPLPGPRPTGPAAIQTPPANTVPGQQAMVPASTVPVPLSQASAIPTPVAPNTPASEYAAPATPYAPPPQTPAPVYVPAAPAYAPPQQTPAPAYAPPASPATAYTLPLPQAPAYAPPAATALPTAASTPAVRPAAANEWQPAGSSIIPSVFPYGQ